MGYIILPFLAINNKQRSKENNTLSESTNTIIVIESQCHILYTVFKYGKFIEYEGVQKIKAVLIYLKYVSRFALSW
jgi:hypothetical protein